MGAVELDAVKAHLLGGLGRVHKVGPDLVHIGGGDIGGLHLIGALHAAGGSQQLAADHVLFGHVHVQARVHELEDEATAGLVDGVQDLFLAGPLLGGSEAHLDAGGPGFGGDVAVGSDDGAGAGGGDLPVELHLLGVAGAVPVAEGVLGGRADEPVGQGEGADLAGGEESCCHRVKSPFQVFEALENAPGRGSAIRYSIISKGGGNYKRKGEGWRSLH